MMARTSNVTGVDFVRKAGDMHRMENVTSAKVEEIVKVVRAILTDEINRKPGKGHGNYVGLHLWRKGTIVNYAESYESTFGEASRHFLTFENEEDAKCFHFILCGILMLGLSRWNIGDRWPQKVISADLDMIPDVEQTLTLEAIPEDPPSVTHYHIVPDVAAFDFFER